MPIAAFRIERTDDEVIVHVHGQIDLSSADELSSAVTRAISTGQPAPEHVWVDLSEVSFFDSAGVNALFALNKDLRAFGLQLGVVAPKSSQARVVLDIVQLARLMPLREANPSH